MVFVRNPRRHSKGSNLILVAFIQTFALFSPSILSLNRPFLERAALWHSDISANHSASICETLPASQVVDSASIKSVLYSIIRSQICDDHTSLFISSLPSVMALHLPPPRSKAEPRTAFITFGSTNIPSPHLRSPDQVGRSLPPKRKFPLSFEQGPQSLQGQSRPHPPKSESEGALSPGQPTTPKDVQCSFRKRAKSTPGNIIEAGQGAIDDKAIPIHGFTKKPYTSPCGKKEYVKRGHLINHENTCKICKPLLQERDTAGIQRKGIVPGRSSSTQDEDNGGATTIGNNATEVYEADSKHKTVSTPKSASCTQIHKQDSCLATMNAAEDSTDSDSRISAMQDIPGEGVETSSKDARAMTADGITLDLEDGIYLEGKPPSSLCPGSLQLHARLKEKIEERLTPKDQRGCVYILSDPKRPHLHKIGRAKNTLKRKLQLSYSCGLRLELIESVEVQNYIRTESLIHTYIAGLCRPYRCESCGTRHGEWFEINKESARTYVARWGAFMNKEGPYDMISKDLHPFFRNLISIREGVLRSSDVETVRRNWEQILSTTIADRFGYMVRIIWEVVWRFYWPVNSMIAWTITFVVIRHPVTFILMAASVIGTFVTMAHDLHYLWHDSKTSKKRRSK